MWSYMCLESVASSGIEGVELRLKGRSRRLRPWAGLGLIALLGMGTVGCEDLRGDRFDRDGRFWAGNGRGDRDGFGRGRGGRFWHHGRNAGANGSGSPDAGADAGAGDGGLELDAGAAAEVADAAAAPDASGDAGATGVAALEDGQLVLLADTLLAGELDRARTALPSLLDADVLAFAEQSSEQLDAARGTLDTLASAIGVSPAASSEADAVRAATDEALAQLVAPDAGGLDALFLSSQLEASTRSLDELAQMIAAADAPELRAQLVVLRALQQQDSSRLRELTLLLGD
jgi:uncharacterized protein DUF4142